MDPYLVAIILTTVGFFALAALLLVPVWRFLNREEEISSLWTDETVGGIFDEEAPAPSEKPDDGPSVTAR